MRSGEAPVRMAVDGQALARVEQLDEQPGVGPEALDVRRAEEALGVGGERLLQRPPVGQPAQPRLPFAEERRGRADPVLGRVLVVGRPVRFSMPLRIIFCTGSAW